MSTYTTLEKLKIRLRQFTEEVVVVDVPPEEPTEPVEPIEEPTEPTEPVEQTTEAQIVFTQLSENPILENNIEKATADVTLKRNYPPAYTAEMITADLAKHESIVLDLALFDYVTEGAEFQNSHNENGISRGYESRDDILNKVISFAHVV